MIRMAIAGPAQPTAPTPPTVPGFAGASEAVGGLPDFGASGQAAVEGAQERAAAAVQTGQDAAANARAAGERLMGAPERKTTGVGAEQDGGAKGKLEQTPTNAAADVGGAKSQATVSEAAKLPPAAQAAQTEHTSMTGSETRTVSTSPAEEPQGFDMLHLALVAVLLAAIAGVFAYAFLRRKKDAPTPAMRAAREAELLAELETIRAAREKREADRAAAVAAAGLCAIAGDWTRGAAETQAADGTGEAAGAARDAASASAGAAKMPPSTDTAAAAPDTSMLASLSEALAAFREASGMMDDGARAQAAEEARKATRIAEIRQDREGKKDGEHGGFEIRI